MNRSRRAAFLLNINAKSVTKDLLKQLSSLIPTGDLYLSKNLLEAESNIAKIMDKGYAYIFCGGGDGTVVSTINLLKDYGLNHPHAPVLPVGVLGLGTGNAIARFLHANKPSDDIKAILSGKAIKQVNVFMVESDAGQLTPFAGIGYDGELMNDYESVKEIFFNSPFRKFFSSFFGFTFAGIFKTLPRQIGKHAPIVRIKSSKPSYRIERINGVDREVLIENAAELYHGKAPLICVGTIPLVGLSLKLFPFATKRPGFMHLRVSNVPLSVCLANLYPSIWNGSFRHKKLFDFLVKDVKIESSSPLPYQLGGDAMGYKKNLEFKVSDKPISMAKITLDKNHISTYPAMTPL
jgi:diacylglycerol kinase family enzyme